MSECDISRHVALPGDHDSEYSCCPELSRQEQHEHTVVAESYAVVQPHTVVVHAGYHEPCKGAVLTPAV